MIHDHKPPEERKRAYNHDSHVAFKVATLGLSAYAGIHLIADDAALAPVSATGILSVLLHLSLASLVYGFYCARKHNKIHA